MAALPAVYDEEMIKRLAAMASPADMLAQTGPDILRINYEEESEYPRGVWVVGQRKNDKGEITEQGEVIDKVIILAARCRYSFYDKTSKETIATQIFEGGNQPPDKAEVAARVSAVGGELKFQTVLLGLTLSSTSKPREFISYLGGVAYKPLKAHLIDLSTIITPERKIPIPLFSYVTILGPTEKGKNGTTTYFIPTFKKGPIIKMEQVKALSAARDKAQEYINMHNATMANQEKKVAPPASAPPSSEMYTPPEPDLSGMKSANPIPTDFATPPPMTEEDVPFDLGKESVTDVPQDDDSYDIEAAMKAILQG